MTDSSERRDLINLDERETNKRRDKHQTTDPSIPLSGKIQNHKLSNVKTSQVDSINSAVQLQ